MNDNIEKVLSQIFDLLEKRIDKLKDKITEVCKSEAGDEEV